MRINNNKFQGKSLSLICGAICWLQDHEERKRRQLKAAIAQLDVMKNCDGGGDTDWLTQQTQQSQVLQQQQQLQQQLNKILRNDEKLEQLRKHKEKVSLISINHAMRLLKLCAKC
jgi:chromosome transmission fidelity protein 1